MFTFAHIIIIDISMTKSKHNKNNRKKIKIVSGIIVICALAICFFCFSSMSNNGKTKYVFIDHNDNIDSVYYKLEKVSTKHSFWAFKLLANLFSYKNHIRPGKYTIDNSGALMTFRNFRNGKQASISLTIRSVRTLGDLATDVSGKLMFSRKELIDSLTSETTCKKYGYTPKNIIAMFIPNTYDFYWNTSVSDFLEKMYKENKKFWDFDRTKKAENDGLNKEEVMTLASIVDEETSNEGEMPKIAGMYINRLRKNMPLQADPTVKFALGKFEAHRIYHKWLSYDSPYNTYKYKGLPPGPIRIPSVAAIEAVLNYVHHNYLYMCAKEDFSGTHNFAETYEEHSVNAAKYAKALTEHGIE